MRGENFLVSLLKYTATGTSPRARGKPVQNRKEIYTTRNIPACAGKTDFWRDPAAQDQEHPRVRGENTY